MKNRLKLIFTLSYMLFFSGCSMKEDHLLELHKVIVCDLNFDITDLKKIDHVYLKQEYPLDTNENGKDDHFLTRLTITDGVYRNGIYMNQTYVLNLVLLSNDINEFKSDLYLSASNATVETDSYLSIITSSYSDINGRSLLKDGIVNITKQNDVFQVCFNTISKSGIIIKGSFEGILE